jgi:hypothetical protein
MIGAGLRILASQGLSIGLDSIKFDDVIQEASAPRASAYRAWSDPDRPEGPQVLFQDALAAKLLREQPGDAADPNSEGALNATMESVTQILENELPADLAALTAEKRGWWLRRMYRVGSNANQGVMDSSRLWATYMAVASSLASMSRDQIPPDILDAWQNGEDLLAARYKDLYSTMATMFGFRLRYCYTWEQFDVVAAALAEGLAMRARVNRHAWVSRQTGPGGEAEDWSLFAIAFEGLIRQFFEPDPEAEFHSTLDHEQSGAQYDRP